VNFYFQLVEQFEYIVSFCRADVMLVSFLRLDNPVVLAAQWLRQETVDTTKYLSVE
jgi:hypothetical protein